MALSDVRLVNCISRARGVLCVSIQLNVFLFCSNAIAQDESAIEQEYNAVISDALTEHKLGNWEEAKALFRQAHQIKPSARTLRGLGITCFEARDYLEAIEALQFSLDEQRNPLTPNLRTQVQKLLNRARKYVAHVELDLVPNDATIAIDGRQIQRVDGEIQINPGERELVVSAEGYQTLTRQVRVESGETLALELVLEPIESTTIDSDTLPTSEAVLSKERSEPIDNGNVDESSSDVLPWVIVSASSAIAIAGGVLFGLGLNDISEVENAKRGTF